MSATDAGTIVVPRWSPALRVPRFLCSKEGGVGLVLLCFVLGVALLGPLLAPHPLAAPIGVPGAGPSGAAPLGTDFLGRDVLSRILFGGLPVVVPAVVSIALTYVIGGSIGMVAGLSRRLDPVLMRTVDIFLVFPPLLLLLLLIAGAGSGTWTLILGVVLVLFPGVARIVRTATLQIASAGYVEAALGRGERRFTVMRLEILPNVTPSILADLGVRFSGAIVIAASVNFLGLGSQPPAANWALMVAENRPILTTNLFAVLAPASLLAMLTISVNLLADAYVKSLGRSDSGR